MSHLCSSRYVKKRSRASKGVPLFQSGRQHGARSSDHSLRSRRLRRSRDFAHDRILGTTKQRVMNAALIRDRFLTRLNEQALPVLAPAKPAQ